jgi:hypothetical protein
MKDNILCSDLTQFPHLTDRCAHELALCLLTTYVLAEDGYETTETIESLDICIYCGIVI